MRISKTILFYLLFCISFFPLGCNKDIPETKESNVSYIKINDLKSDEIKEFFGSVKSQRVSQLSFQTEGKIDFMPYEKGDFVKRGTVLARLDGVLYKIRKNEETLRLKDIDLNLNKSKSYFERMDKLHKKGAISDNDWEDAYYKYRNNIQLVKIQKEKIRYIDEEINYNIITAPFDGFISQKLSEIGSYAKIGSPVYVLNGSNKTQVETVVDSDIINDLDLDKTVTITRNNINYPGKITHISKTSRQEGGYLLRIELDNLYDELKDGMTISAYFSSKNNPYIASVPFDSVFEKDNEKYVYKIVNIKNNSGTVEEEKVTIKDIKNEEIEISKGINKGDIIITKDLNRFFPGAKIKL